VPYQADDYSIRLNDAINQLDSALCQGLLSLINEYYPFSNDNETPISISTDYPYTSALVQEYPQFATIIRHNNEIFDLVTMRSRINRPNVDAQAQSQKTAQFIHLSIKTLMQIHNSNSDQLMKLDRKFVQILSNYSRDFISCRDYLNKNVNKKKLKVQSRRTSTISIKKNFNNFNHFLNK
jgi:5-carboxymethyl-2-hydroxymuconate isomerase